MDGVILHNNERVHYSDIGEGFPIVFLHGYLEAKEIWLDFVSGFPNWVRRICIDLPGHGESTFTGERVGMEGMAEAVRAVLLELGVEKCLLVGHSMGGYASLAFKEMFPEYLSGVVLFHSTPNADTPEKKDARAREETLVEQGKKDQIVRQSIPKGFANSNLDRCKQQVAYAVRIALTTPDSGIRACLRGMAERKDRNGILAGNAVPAMMIFGCKDNHIALTVAEAIAGRFPEHRSAFLESSGHMGFFEEEGKARALLLDFYRSVVTI